MTMHGVRLARALPPHANGEAGRAATEGPQTVITSHFGHPHIAHLRLPFAAGLAAISWRNTGPLPSRRKKILRWFSSTTSGWSPRCCASAHKNADFHPLLSKHYYHHDRRWHPRACK
jgi:hypothetical protein